MMYLQRKPIGSSSCATNVYRRAMMCLRMKPRTSSCATNYPGNIDTKEPQKLVYIEEQQKIQARGLSGTEASATNKTTKGRDRKVGFRGCSGKISEGKSGREPSSESVIGVAHRGHDTLFQDLFRIGADCDKRIRDD